MDITFIVSCVFFLMLSSMLMFSSHAFVAFCVLFCVTFTSLNAAIPQIESVEKGIEFVSWSFGNMFGSGDKEKKKKKDKVIQKKRFHTAEEKQTHGKSVLSGPKKSSDGADMMMPKMPNDHGAKKGATTERADSIAYSDKKGFKKRDSAKALGVAPPISAVAPSVVTDKSANIPDESSDRGSLDVEGVMDRGLAHGTVDDAKNNMSGAARDNMSGDQSILGNDSKVESSAIKEGKGGAKSRSSRFFAVDPRTKSVMDGSENVTDEYIKEYQQDVFPQLSDDEEMGDGGDAKWYGEGKKLVSGRKISDALGMTIKKGRKRVDNDDLGKGDYLSNSHVAQDSNLDSKNIGFADAIVIEDNAANDDISKEAIYIPDTDSIDNNMDLAMENIALDSGIYNPNSVKKGDIVGGLETDMAGNTAVDSGHNLNSDSADEQKSESKGMFATLWAKLTGKANDDVDDTSFGDVDSEHKLPKLASKKLGGKMPELPSGKMKSKKNLDIGEKPEDSSDGSSLLSTLPAVQSIAKNEKEDEKSDTNTNTAPNMNIGNRDSDRDSFGASAGIGISGGKKIGRNGAEGDVPRTNISKMPPPMLPRSSTSKIGSNVDSVAISDREGAAPQSVPAMPSRPGGMKIGSNSTADKMSNTKKNLPPMLPRSSGSKMADNGDLQAGSKMKDVLPKLPSMPPMSSGNKVANNMVPDNSPATNISIDLHNPLSPVGESGAGNRIDNRLDNVPADLMTVPAGTNSEIGNDDMGVNVASKMNSDNGIMNAGENELSVKEMDVKRNPDIQTDLARNPSVMLQPEENTVSRSVNSKSIPKKIEELSAANGTTSDFNDEEEELDIKQRKALRMRYDKLWGANEDNTGTSDKKEIRYVEWPNEITHSANNDDNQHIANFRDQGDMRGDVFRAIHDNNIGYLSDLIYYYGEHSENFRNGFGDTPLMYAVRKGRADVVLYLVNQGFNPNAVNYDTRETALSVARKMKRVSIERVLLSAINSNKSRMMHKAG